MAGTEQLQWERLGEGSRRVSTIHQKPCGVTAHKVNPAPIPSTGPRRAKKSTSKLWLYLLTLVPAEAEQVSFTPRSLLLDRASRMRARTRVRMLFREPPLGIEPRTFSLQD